jgi:hypothetical protein
VVQTEASIGSHSGSIPDPAADADTARVRILTTLATCSGRSPRSRTFPAVALVNDQWGSPIYPPLPGGPLGFWSLGLGECLGSGQEGLQQTEERDEGSTEDEQHLHLRIPLRWQARGVAVALVRVEAQPTTPEEVDAEDCRHPEERDQTTEYQQRRPLGWRSEVESGEAEHDRTDGRPESRAVREGIEARNDQGAHDATDEGAEYGQPGRTCPRKDQGRSYDQAPEPPRLKEDLVAGHGPGMNTGRGAWAMAATEPPLGVTTTWPA